MLRMPSEKGWLESKRLPAVAIAVACVLSLPTLGGGLRLDDLVHRAKLTGGAAWNPESVGWSTMFEFVRGTPEEHARYVEVGLGPWWIAPHLRMSFFRPVSCLTHVLDYALWPQHPALMHAHSILWYVALLCVVVTLFRRFLGPRAANVAILFYAIDPAHGLPVGWVANRNALIAATFAFGALWLWDRGKIWRSSLLLAIALASGESATAILGFFVAHWLFIDRRPLRAAAPIALTVALWAAVYRLGHHGVVGSGAYADPVHAPVGYASGVLAHLPLLLGGELGAPPADAYVFAGAGARIVLVLLGLAFVAWTARLVPRTSTTKFFAVGALLAAFPSAATMPSGRLLVIAGFGLIGLVATICTEKISRPYAIWAWLTHVVLAPVLFIGNAQNMVLIDGVLRRYAAGVPSDGSAADKRLMLVNAPDTAFAYYLLVDALEDGLSPPRRMLTMSGNRRDLRVTRAAENALVIHEEGGFYRDSTEMLFRDRTPMHVGEVVEQSDTRITVVHVLPDGTPDEARFEMTRPLDGYVFRAWQGRALVPFDLPPVGESVSFPAQMVSLF